MFLMWLGEQITARGIGNGISLIIMAGIVANLPHARWVRPSNSAAPARSRLSSSACSWDGDRSGLRHRLHGAGRSAASWCSTRNASRANRMFGGEASHLPLKINTSGVIPPIFASSLLLLPATIGQLQVGSQSDDCFGRLVAAVTAYVAHGTPLYMALYIGLIVFFCFFYTAIVFNPVETADNLRKYGGFVPGIRRARTPPITSITC